MYSHHFLRGLHPRKSTNSISVSFHRSDQKYDPLWISLGDTQRCPEEFYPKSAGSPRMDLVEVSLRVPPFTGELLQKIAYKVDPLANDGERYADVYNFGS